MLLSEKSYMCTFHTKSQAKYLAVISFFWVTFGSSSIKSKFNEQRAVWLQVDPSQLRIQSSFSAVTETLEKMLDRRQERGNKNSEILFRLFWNPRMFSQLVFVDSYFLKNGIVESWDSFVVEYLLTLVDNPRLKCFGALWVTSSRHGPLFTQQCYSPTRCYGKFGLHNGLGSSGEGYYLRRSSRFGPLNTVYIW